MQGGAGTPCTHCSFSRVLGEWRDQESRPAMESALKDGSLRVKRCAELALKELDKPKAVESRE